MKYLLTVLIAVAAVLAAQSGTEPDRSIERRMRAHEWRVEFANGVVQTCSFGENGAAGVSEPLRRSRGNAKYENGAAVVSYNDDRVERWTLVGNRFVVEHWYPASQMWSTPGVLGIAEKSNSN